jgi:hypothetical protein
MSSLNPIFPVCCTFCCIFAVGYCCVEDLLCMDERVSKNAHDDSSQPYGLIVIMINDYKEYFGYHYDLAKSGFLFLVNPLKLLFYFKENRSMILGGISSTIAAKGDIIFIYIWGSFSCKQGWLEKLV